MRLRYVPQGVPDPLALGVDLEKTQVIPGVLVSPFNSTLKYPLFVRDFFLLKLVFSYGV